MICPWSIWKSESLFFKFTRMQSVLVLSPVLPMSRLYFSCVLLFEAAILILRNWDSLLNPINKSPMRACPHANSRCDSSHLSLKNSLRQFENSSKKKIFSFSGNFIYSHNPFFWWFIGIVTRKIYVGHFCWPKMKWLSPPRVPKNIYQFATVIYWVIHNRESCLRLTTKPRYFEKESIKIIHCDAR